jgi:hypothetical protein
MNLCIDLDGAMAQTLLDGHKEAMQFYRLNYAPLIFINNFLYKGNPEKIEHLVESICMSFEDPPEQCKSLNIFEEYNDFTASSLVSFVTNTLKFFFCIFCVVIFGYYCFVRRRMKNKMNKELSNKVNTAIMKYYGTGQTDGGYEGVGSNTGNMTEAEKKIAEENNILSSAHA